MRSSDVEEGEALTVDPCTNRWYIAMHGGEPDPTSEIGQGSKVVAAKWLFDSVPFTQSIRKRKPA